MSAHGDGGSAFPSDFYHALREPKLGMTLRDYFLACAGAAYALNAGDQLNPMSQGDGDNAPPVFWPWATRWWKPKNPRRDLVRAAALIIAEIERLDRAAKPEPTRDEDPLYHSNY